MVSTPIRRAALALICMLAAPAVARAAAEAAAEVACGPKAALYSTAKNLKVWVVRRGEMGRENPLRPLVPEQLVVLQVVVNGRLATAYGGDYDNLHQGGPLRELEREAVGGIRWREGQDSLPPALRVVSQEGAVLIDGLRFAECGEAPKVRVAAPAARTTDTRDKPDRKAAEERSRPPPNLPQGAVGGLALPGRGNK